MRPASRNEPVGLAGGQDEDIRPGRQVLVRLAGLADLGGRLAVAALFWWSAFLDILPTWPETVDYVAAHGIPFPWAASVAALAVEIGGPVLLLTPGLEMAGALVLACYCLATALFFHAFWTLDGDDRATQLVQCLKNVALAGALLTLAAKDAAPRRGPAAD